MTLPSEVFPARGIRLLTLREEQSTRALKCGSKKPQGMSERYSPLTITCLPVERTKAQATKYLLKMN